MLSLSTFSMKLESLFFLSADPSRVDLPRDRIVGGIAGIIVDARISPSNFLRGAGFLDAKLRARFASTDKSPPDVEPCKSESISPTDIVSRNGRVSQYSRNAERRFPPSEFAGSRDHFDTREGIRDLSTSRSLL